MNIRYRYANDLKLYINEASLEKEEAIKGYLRSIKIDFDSRKDLFKLVEYFRGLSP
jgi:hypothetical protein